MKVGFTGTRNGMTPEQRVAFNTTLLALKHTRGADEFHSGDCIGADRDAHEMAVAQGFRTVGHPPIKDKTRAFCVYDETRELKDYKARDKDIVNESDLLIATPKGYAEEWRGSGTWLTIRYARKQGRSVFIIWPNGHLYEQD